VSQAKLMGDPPVICEAKIDRTPLTTGKNYQAKKKCRWGGSGKEKKK